MKIKLNAFVPKVIFLKKIFISFNIKKIKFLVKRN